jgi:hypothetical protein
VTYALPLPCKEMVKEGFQLCTGLKCKRRCGMDEAVCEPELRRACLCNRENIIIDEHLWSRMPSAKESKCQETCNSHNLGKLYVMLFPVPSKSLSYFMRS